MKFNIDNYKGKYVMHCKTYDEAVNFCNYLHSMGRCWINGRKYYEYTNWERYKTKTIYYFNKGSYGEIDLVNQGYTVLEWSDFMDMEKETASLNNKGIDHIKEVFELLGVSPEEIFKVGNIYSADYKITKKLKVLINQDREYWATSAFTIADFLTGEVLICKKPIPTEIEQIAINYALACGCHWLAKDNNNTVYAYKEKPKKKSNSRMWDDNGNGILEIELPISFLSWEDEVPYYIGD